ncbi:secreted phosphoprotein 24-like [Carcharodon carcharias]|uniref:secreted phosphoprotein 24-like n=1 Tax=Carcharodon carcharias TaxID=13397 RepID=UPI001B7D9270|nr:secreted phosphoprotein 24-like [Carcharodon carcharias]
MKFILFTFAAAQILSCSGIPCRSSTFSQIGIVIDATIAKVNEEFTMNNLLALVNCEVTSVQDFGEGIFKVNLTVDVQETVCNRSSGLDPANCALIPIPDAVSILMLAICFSIVINPFTGGFCLTVKCTMTKHGTFEI